MAVDVLFDESVAVQTITVVPIANGPVMLFESIGFGSTSSLINGATISSMLRVVFRPVASNVLSPDVVIVGGTVSVTASSS